MRKTVTITLYESELMHDVLSKSYVNGQIQGKDAVERSQLQVVGEDENYEMVHRSFNNAVGVVANILCEYLPQYDLFEDVSNILDEYEDNELVIYLSMPSNYNTGATDALVRAIHEYIVNAALADWYAAVDNKQVKQYADAATDALNRVGGAASRRMRPVRSDSTPNLHVINITHDES